MIPETENFNLSFGYCPKCSSPLRLRKNRKNGSFFAGCTKFPKCRHTKSIPFQDVQRLMEITIAYVPVLLGLIDLPEFLRGEQELINFVHNLAHEMGDSILEITGAQHGTWLGVLESVERSWYSHGAVFVGQPAE